MESSTAAPESTGSRTIADMLGLAAESYGDRAALTFKRGDEWAEVSYRELGETVSEIAPRADRPRARAGDRAAVLCTHAPRVDVRQLRHHQRRRRRRPDLPDELAGGVRVGGGQLGGALRHLRGRRARSRRSPRSATGCRSSRPSSSSTRPATSATRSRSTSCASAAAAATPPRCRARRAVTPEDPYTFIYTSGTTGPPKGCVLTHGNYRAVGDMCEAARSCTTGDVVYLYLPLAHSFALLIQLIAIDLGGTIAYFGGDTKQIVPELMRGQAAPTSRRCRGSSRRSTRWSPRPTTRRRSGRRRSSA